MIFKSRESSRESFSVDSLLFRSLRIAGVVSLSGALLIALVVSFLDRQVSVSHGSDTDSVTVALGEHEGAVELASDLRDRGIIGSKYAFIYHVLKEGLRTKLRAGNYLLDGTMSIPEIVGKIVRGEVVEKGVKVTFPEGMTAEEMSTRLSSNGLSGEAFLDAVRNPDPSLSDRYPFLSIAPPSATLEGFLFPDTYFFDPKLGADSIVEKMLDGFSDRVGPLLFEAEGAGGYDALVLASILETEVRTESDRRIVADIFLRRIEVGMPLQSDATVRYALGEIKIKHSLDDISVESPYNTYANKGLPPGPISNPGLVSIWAALDPAPSPYWFFLNNPETGKTVFSATFEEHIVNKAKNGL